MYREIPACCSQLRDLAWSDHLPLTSVVFIVAAVAAGSRRHISLNMLMEMQPNDWQGSDVCPQGPPQSLTNWFDQSLLWEVGFAMYGWIGWASSVARIRIWKGMSVLSLKKVKVAYFFRICLELLFSATTRLGKNALDRGTAALFHPLSGEY